MEPAIIALLALLTLAVAWAVLEIRSLRESIQPVAESPLVRALSGLGEGL